MSSENWADKLRNFEGEKEAEKNAKIAEQLEHKKRIYSESEKSLEFLKDLGVGDMLQGIKKDLWGVGVITSFKFDADDMTHLSGDTHGWAQYRLSLAYPCYYPYDHVNETGDCIGTHKEGLGVGITYNTILNYLNGKINSDNSVEGLFVTKQMMSRGSKSIVIPLNKRVNQDLERVFVEDAYGRDLPYTNVINMALRDIRDVLKSHTDLSGREYYEDFVRKGFPSYPAMFEEYLWTPPSNESLKNGHAEIWQPK